MLRSFKRQLAIFTLCINILSCGGSTEQVPVVTDPFCASRYRLEFCEDFDESDTPGRFTKTEIQAAMMLRQTGETTSKPYALHLHSMAQEGLVPQAQLVKKFPTGVKFRMFFHMFLEALPQSDSDIEVASYDFQLGAGFYRIAAITNNKGEWWAVESNAQGTKKHASKATVALKEWTSVRLDINLLENGSGTLTFKLGDSTALAYVPISPGAASLAPEVRIGLRVLRGEHSGWSVRMDTFTFQND